MNPRFVVCPFVSSITVIRRHRFSRIRAHAHARSSHARVRARVAPVLRFRRVTSGLVAYAYVHGVRLRRRSVAVHRDVVDPRVLVVYVLLRQVKMASVLPVLGKSTNDTCERPDMTDFEACTFLPQHEALSVVLATTRAM